MLKAAVLQSPAVTLAIMRLGRCVERLSRLATAMINELKSGDFLLLNIIQPTRIHLLKLSTDAEKYFARVSLFRPGCVEE
jgi:hypothetical protein